MPDAACEAWRESLLAVAPPAGAAAEALPGRVCRERECKRDELTRSESAKRDELLVLRGFDSSGLEVE